MADMKVAIDPATGDLLVIITPVATATRPIVASSTYRIPYKDFVLYAERARRAMLVTQATIDAQTAVEAKLEEEQKVAGYPIDQRERRSI